MDNVSQIVQKVRQAPWRVQRQWIVLFLLAFVAVAMVAGLYLNITVRATLAGREIQKLQSNITDTGQNDTDLIPKALEMNSNLEVQLAGLNSMESMRARAEALGFEPAKPEDITYVLIPGYVPQAVGNLPAAENAGQTGEPKPVLLPVYTESLFDWATRMLTAPTSSGGQP